MTPYVFLLMPAAVLLLFALVETRLARSRLRAGRRLAAAPHAALAASLLLASVALLVLAASLLHFRTLQAEAGVALIEVRQMGPQRFDVRLETASAVREFELLGDEWQIDARVLRWKLPAVLAGAPNLYRLERLSGRYARLAEARELPPSVHGLAEDAFPDLWTLRRQFPAWLPFVDADFGSAAYMPLLDGARYEIQLGVRGGLVARAADSQTEALLRSAGW